MLLREEKEETPLLHEPSSAQKDIKVGTNNAFRQILFYGIFEVRKGLLKMTR